MIIDNLKNNCEPKCKEVTLSEYVNAVDVPGVNFTNVTLSGNGFGGSQDTPPWVITFPSAVNVQLIPYNDTNFGLNTWNGAGGSTTPVEVTSDSVNNWVLNSNTPDLVLTNTGVGAFSGQSINPVQTTQDWGSATLEEVTTITIDVPSEGGLDGYGLLVQYPIEECVSVCETLEEIKADIEEPEIAYEFVDFFDLGSQAGDEENFFQRSALYATTQASFANGTFTASKMSSVSMHTEDGEIHAALSVTPSDTKGYMLVAPYPFTNSPQSFNIGTESPNSDHNLLFYEDNNQGIVDKYYVVFNDLDQTGLIEEIDLSANTIPFTIVTNAPAPYNIGNFTESGGVYTPIGQNNALVIEIDPSDVNSFTSFNYKLTTDQEPAASSASISIFASYYRPLISTEAGYVNFEGQVIPESDANFRSRDALIANSVIPSDFERANYASIPDWIISKEFEGDTGPYQTREVANATVNSGQNINDNDVLDVTSQLAEGNWAVTAEGFIYNGTADYIVVNATVKGTLASNAQRPAPLLGLQTRVGTGVYATVYVSATSYIRNLSGHTEASNQIFYRFIAPPAGSEFRLATGIESIAGAVNSNFGQFDLEAITNV